MNSLISYGNAWLRCYRPLPLARVRLVCLPHAGGAATAYRHWPAHLPEHIELHAVQYPGREERLTDACITELHRLADHITAALTPLLDRPLVLFGHSMGAAVAHEVALRLRRRKCPPAHLCVSGFPAPMHHQAGTVHCGTDADLIAELHRLGGTDREVLADPELRELVLPIVRADYRAIETYQPTPEPPLSCPVTAFVGDDDPTVTLTEARDWARYTTGRFSLHSYPGHHFYLSGQEHEVVAEVVRSVTAGHWTDLP